MGRLFLVNLEGKIYSCKHCHTHLALCDSIVSKSFHYRHGKAYLFSKVPYNSAASPDYSPSSPQYSSSTGYSPIAPGYSPSSTNQYTQGSNKKSKKENGK